MNERPRQDGAKLRLNRFLADAGVASRRDAEAIVAAGQVTVNGHAVDSPGTLVDPGRDAVKILGRRVRPQANIYLLLHKPEGILSTVDDPQHRRTVLDCLPDLGARVYPVGRLDGNTSGALLLTNDGELALRLTHPRYGFERTYHAKVNDVPSEGDLRRLAQGVNIPAPPGRFVKTLPARVRLLRRWEKNALLEITLREGRHHQVRKMCAAVGHPVIKLTRVAFGFLTLAGLPPGRWRRLSPREVERLRRCEGTPARPRPRRTPPARGRGRRRP